MMKVKYFIFLLAQVSFKNIMISILPGPEDYSKVSQYKHDFISIRQRLTNISIQLIEKRFLWNHHLGLLRIRKLSKCFPGHQQRNSQKRNKMWYILIWRTFPFQHISFQTDWKTLQFVANKQTSYQTRENLCNCYTMSHLMKTNQYFEQIAVNMNLFSFLLLLCKISFFPFTVD